MTNYEQIKNMTVEELAELLDDITLHCRYDGEGCKKCRINPKGICCKNSIETYLKSEAEQ